MKPQLDGHKGNTMTAAPNIRRRYKGGFTNTDRWARFTPRSGDVFVSTPPKCGTTWTTTIVAMLCQGTTDVNSAESVQWLDAEVVPIEEAVAALQAHEGRRCIKSHTPFDGMPYYADATYIAVYRHPIDMLFSHRKHTANMKCAAPDHPYLGDADGSLKYFINRALDFDDYDDGILAAMVRHYLSFITAPVPENVLAIHYSDMLADARSVIGQICAMIGAAPDDPFLDEIHEATKFSSMKAQADRYAPFANRDFWHDSAAFFDSGGTGKWDGKLSKAALSDYRQHVASMMSAKQLAWLEHGSAGQ